MSMPSFFRTLSLCTLMTALPALAQDECNDYHKFNCERSPDARFKLNGQSKSASVKIGVPTELNIIVHKGQDYRISFCYDEKVIGDHVVARLVELVREPREVPAEGETEKKPIMDENGQPTGNYDVVKKEGTKTVFEEVRKVLWDNQEHDMTNEVEFTATSSKRLIVEIIAPGAANAKPKRSDKEFDIGCVGILIEHMPTPNVGFEAPK